MTCDDVRRRLTAYLDGELDATGGSAVRGHLRGCAACRAAAGDEAALRDGLRALPPLDPPASLWAGVQRRLAAEEVADAERPAWRRVMARWRRWLPHASRVGLAGAAVAAAAALVVWRAHRPEGPIAVAPPPVHPPAVHAPEHAPPAPRPGDDLDVSDDLAAAPARQTAAYADTASELLASAAEARTRWTDARKHTFDTKVAELRGQIDKAPEGRPRQAAYRELIRYLQSAAIRDEVAANDRVFAGGCP